jgi:hypothetical protein
MWRGKQNLKVLENTMSKTIRGLGRKTQIVAAMAFAGAAPLIGQHAQAATVGGNKKAGAINTTDKPAAAKSRDWSHTGNMTGGQKAVADAGAFARKAMADGKSLTNRQGHAAAMSPRASWRTRSRHLWSTPPVSQRTDYT